MRKSKIIIIFASAALVLVWATVCAVVCYYMNLPPAPVKDTLRNGRGKEATVIILAGQSNAAGCSRIILRKTCPRKSMRNNFPEELRKTERG